MMLLTKKREALEQMSSQFSDIDSWTYGRADNPPEDESTRLRLRIYNLMNRSINVADKYRAMLIKLYGVNDGNRIKHAEAFQVSEYGRAATTEELKALFPTF